MESSGPAPLCCCRRSCYLFPYGARQRTQNLSDCAVTVQQGRASSPIATAQLGDLQVSANKLPSRHATSMQAMRFHSSMEEVQSCMLDLELVSEERCSSQAALQYPVNAVRNRALMNVKTEVC